MNPSFRPVFALVLGLMLSPIAHAETTNVSVTIDVVNAKSPVISVTYGNNSRQLTIADDAAIEIDGKKSDYRALLPGDKAVVTYDKVRAAVTKIVVQRDAIAPAEALAEGWDEIDQRLIFLMIRLANVEASLEAIEKAIDADSRKKSGKANTARKADRDNEALDRKGGGPVKWSQFYGMTAEKFFYHPTDRNTTYHTRTILSQNGPEADNKVGGGVPASQGLPVHQRPPQFDYIYRANESAKARAEMEASELVGKIDALNERRQRLEAEQAGLWVEIAFRAISHYDLDQKPAYRFEPALNDLDAEYVQRTEVMKSAASFMALALSIIGESEKNQQGTFLKLKPAVAKGRQTLNDSYLRLAVESTDSQSSVGRFVALAKRLDDVSANLTDSYSVATEGDLAGDQLRKDTFRALLQSSLINYAQIILAMDEMAELMKEECKYRPNVDKSIQFVGLANVEAVRALPAAASQPLQGGSKTIQLFNGKDLSGWKFVPIEYSQSKQLQSWFADAKRSVLVCDGSDRNELATTSEFQDFILRFEWRWRPNSPSTPNGSGVVIRSRGLDEKKTNPVGIEIDLRPSITQGGVVFGGKRRNVGTGNLIGYERAMRNSVDIADGFDNRVLGFLKAPVQKNAGEWNTCTIECKDDWLKVMINDSFVNEAFGLKQEKGMIVLRNQATGIEFRQIEITTP